MKNLPIYIMYGILSKYTPLLLNSVREAGGGKNLKPCYNGLYIFIIFYLNLDGVNINIYRGL